MSKNIYTFHYTYLIVNKNSQMKYIGVRSCSCLPENDDEYMGSSKILGEALNKNPEYFTKTIIGTFPTREMANADEQRLHEMFDVARNSMFYNLCIAPVGFNMCGRIQTVESRKKQSIVKMGPNNPFYGKTHTDETKKKQSKAQSGKYLSEEHKKKIGKSVSGSKNHNYGKHHSAEHKKKLSVSQMGKTISPETRAKMSEAAMGKIISPETRQKLSAAGMDRTHSPETRQKIGESNKGKIYERITCPHCSKIGGNNIMKRWHFSNCREIA